MKKRNKMIDIIEDYAWVVGFSLIIEGADSYPKGRGK